MSDRVGTHEGPAPNDRAEPRTIACLGASLTFGRGLSDRRNECYPAVLQQLLAEAHGEGAYRVRNFGYSGATASRGGNEPYWRTSNFTAAERFEPHVAILMFGTNDAQFANAAARSTFARDLADLVEHFQLLGTSVYLGQVPPAFPPVPEIDFNALKEVVRPAIAAVAESLHVPLIDFQSPLEGLSEGFPDGLHPTAPIARRIAEIAFEALGESN